MSAPASEVVDLNFQGVPGVIASFFLQRDGDFGLIETGPTSTLEHLLAGIQRHGGLDRLTSIAVTHIHLDHAGAVGSLLRMAPHVKCYVHSLGRPHLVDPSRLLRSATMIYGDRMDELWGQFVPAPEDQVVAVEDGDHISIGGVDLTVVYTPGHARHHVALHDAESGRVFTGDVAGVKLQGSAQVRPPTPPPDLDPAAWRNSIGRLRSLNPSELCLTHFGPVARDIDCHFDSLLTRLDNWIDLVRAEQGAGQDSPAIVDTLQREGDAEVAAAGGSALTLRQYELATPWGMTVDGILHYLLRHTA